MVTKSVAIQMAIIGVLWEADGRQTPDPNVQAHLDALGSLLDETVREEVNNMEREMLEHYGWCVHYRVLDNGLINAHTHNLSKKFGHPDLQIVLPLDRDTFTQLFARIVTMVSSGARFDVGEEYDGVLVGQRVTFVDGLDGKRRVRRLVFPDGAGNLDSREWPFSAQRVPNVELLKGPAGS